MEVDPIHPKPSNHDDEVESTDKSTIEEKSHEHVDEEIGK